jgi:phosphoenolpyruvate phosphomutase
LKGGVSQEQENPEKFAYKISEGKEVQLSSEFMIIARIESLIAGKSVDDAISRAETYLLSGADGIMIHSKEKNPKKIFEFSEKYHSLCSRLKINRPLVAVPTTYNKVREIELEKKGINVVIYANHMLRAAYKAMENVGKGILINHRSYESDSLLIPISTIFEKVGFIDVKKKDELSPLKPTVIIPAAGENNLEGKLKNIPRALIPLGNQTLLEHQINLFKQLKFPNINVIVGYKKNEFPKIDGVNYIENPDYSTKGMLHSLMMAKEKMEN